MSPNLEDPALKIPDIEPNSDPVHLVLTPVSDLSVNSISELQSLGSSESNQSLVNDDSLSGVTVNEDLRNLVSIEHNIRELLIRVANTEDLETVTQIKLRVIARELALQQLGIYLPALRELILDGSVISSLRDLGYGLRNLRILRVNRCQLSCIDGVLGFEFLEELYAADNNIRDLSPCAFLTNLRAIDVSRNLIKNLNSLEFLNLCPDLCHLSIAGNEVTEKISAFRHMIGNLLPHLETIDEEPIIRAKNCPENIQITDIEDEDGDHKNVETTERTVVAFRSSRPDSSPRNANEYIICFPPKVFKGE